MDKSKLIAIVALVLGIGLIAVFKEKPLAPDEDEHEHDAQPTQSAPAPKNGKTVDLAGGIKELQQKDVVIGKGTLAKAGDSVAVNYKGTLLDGTVFDQTKGAPFTFSLGAGEVIKGWDQGVAGMKVGGKRQLVIPSELGYGERGAGASIPPGATLKFDVELLKVNGQG